MIITLTLWCLLWSSIHSECFDKNNTLPIPARSQGPIQPNQEFYVGKISQETGSEGVYWATNGGYNFLFVVYSAGIVVVDAPLQTGWSLRAIQSLNTTKSVTHFIYSHFHTDHVGDANLHQKPGVTFIGHELTANYLVSRSLENNMKKLPLVNISFIDTYEFKVDNYVFQLSYKHNAHLNGNIMIWLPNQKVLMHVDLIFPRWIPFHDLGEMENSTSFLQNVEEILSYDFTYMVCGHLGRLADKADVLEAKAYFTSLITAAQNHLIPPDTYYSELGTDGNFWRFLRVWYEDAACLCAKDLITQWGGILGAVDIYADTHCYLMQQQLRIDANPMNAIHRPILNRKDCPPAQAPNSSSSYCFAFLHILMMLLLLVL